MVVGPHYRSGDLSEPPLELPNVLKTQKPVELGEGVEVDLRAGLAVGEQIGISLLQRSADRQEAHRWMDRNRVADLLQALGREQRRAAAVHHVRQERRINGLGDRTHFLL